MIKHNDQFRGVTHSYLDGIGCAGSHFNYINPDFYRLVPWEGPGYKPVGYGFDSISSTINTIARIEESVSDLEQDRALKRRQELIREVDEKGLIATPANSSVNELVVEAARASILRNGETFRIVYGEAPRLEPRS